GRIKPGDDFVEVLNTQVDPCDVMLVIIGPRWIKLLANRAGDITDFVAIEIRAAFAMGKRVIPVLVGGASMPALMSYPRPCTRSLAAMQWACARSVLERLPRLDNGAKGATGAGKRMVPR